MNCYVILYALKETSLLDNIFIINKTFYFSTDYIVNFLILRDAVIFKTDFKVIFLSIAVFYEKNININ